MKAPGFTNRLAGCLLAVLAAMTPRGERAAHGSGATDSRAVAKLPAKAAARTASKPAAAARPGASAHPQVPASTARSLRPQELRATSPVVAAPRPTARPIAPPPVGSPPERPPAASRANVESRIAAAREAYQAGRYAEVPTALVKLLSESPLSPPQLAAVYELLASAYVALGQTELAIRCFSEVLARRPAFALDPVRTSPKIRAALDQARLQATGLPGTHKPL